MRLGFVISSIYHSHMITVLLMGAYGGAFLERIARELTDFELPTIVIHKIHSSYISNRK